MSAQRFIAISILVISLGMFPARSQNNLQPTPLESLQLQSYETNPTGLQLGFWSVYRYSRNVFEEFGRRPIERAGFYTWRSIEKTPGVYTWPSWDDLKPTHQFGSSVITSINTMFTKEVNKDVDPAIPDFYPQDIRNPKTRAAARAFISAITKELIEQIGDLTIAFDYEMIWFYLPNSEERRQTYRDWYVEAVALSKQVAEQMGKARSLKYIAIVNADPHQKARELIGDGSFENHVAGKWLLDVVSASDYLGMDLYEYSPENPTDPTYTLESIRFWRNYYAQGKPIIITENGFSSVLESHPEQTKGYHRRGNEAQQAEYFKNMISALVRENNSPEGFNHQIKAYCVWMYRDHKPEYLKDNLLEQYFGIKRFDGSPKPAFYALQQEIKRLELTTACAPWRAAGPARSITPGKDTYIRMISGTEFQQVTLTFKLASIPKRSVLLKLQFSQDAYVLYSVNGGIRHASRGNAKSDIQLQIDPADLRAGNNVITFIPTQERWPVSIQLLDATLFITNDQ